MGLYYSRCPRSLGSYWTYLIGLVILFYASVASAQVYNANGYQLIPYHFANLPAVTNNRLITCDDCQNTTPPTGGGTGALLVGQNGQWIPLFAGAGGGGGGGITAAIFPHVLTESAGVATLLVNTSSTANLDSNIIPLNGNVNIHTPAATAMSNGEVLFVEVQEPVGQTYTVNWTAGAGTAFFDNYVNGTNATFGSRCVPSTGGIEWYMLTWNTSNSKLELQACNSNPAIVDVHGVSVSFSGNPPTSIVLPTICPYNLNFAANFGGCTHGVGSCLTVGTNPSETDTYIVKVAGTQIGTLAISTTGVGTFTTTGGLAQSCNVGQRFEVDTPATVSGKDISFTFGGTKS